MTLLQPAAARRVSDALRRSAFTVDGVTATFGSTGEHPVALRLALGDERSPLATLTRLFLLGDAVDIDEASAALPLDDAGPLLERAGSRVRARYDLAPYGDDRHDWYVVADRTDVSGRPRDRDHVLGVGAASTTLAQLTVRTPADRALDIGTGCGVQALHLATHSREVVATDVVPRALELAATTFALSGVDVELLRSDLADEVREQEFDRVVCNPPFVVGPVTRFSYRDGVDDRDGEPDAMSRRAVRAAASVLAPDGVAQLLVNWVHVAGEDWRDRAASWVTDLGCDAWLLERDVQDPAGYVDTWLTDVGERDDAVAAEHWLRWLDERRVEGVGLGWVVLRRTDGNPRIAVEELRQPLDQPLGTSIAGWLDRVEWLRGADDDALLATAFAAAPGVRLDRASVPGPDGWEPAGQLLGLDGGFRWSLPCDEPTAALVGACDGARALHAVVTVLELSTGVPGSELRPAVCATVRGLVDRGLLIPSRT